MYIVYYFFLYFLWVYSLLVNFISNFFPRYHMINFEFKFVHYSLNNMWNNYFYYTYHNWKITVRTTLQWDSHFKFRDRSPTLCNKVCQINQFLRVNSDLMSLSTTQDRPDWAMNRNLLICYQTCQLQGHQGQVDFFIINNCLKPKVIKKAFKSDKAYFF